ncbi:MAG: diguanylate cyclase [Desulfobacteraceae bacterium]|nr:diguanylate cyclase [Desulfobacteraceae bacterium]
MGKIIDKFDRASIGVKLLLTYTSTCLIAFIVGGILISVFVQNTIQSNIERELGNSNKSIMNMVKAAVDSSIMNHLRAIAEKNREIVHYFYERYKQGDISEKKAKTKAQNVLLSQRIGKSGYIYVVDSKSKIRVHPQKNIINTDLSEYDFIQQQVRRLNGYLEYEWPNTDETGTSPKALYMSYFGPWDWIISASSYRDEFNHLFNISDSKDKILSTFLGKSGYPYIIDTEGNIILHPRLHDSNIYNSKDLNGQYYVQKMCKLKNGRITYTLKNTGELQTHQELMIFNYIQDLDWIVASTSYLDEIYKPVRTVIGVLLIIITFVFLSLTLITWWISSSITQPLQQVVKGFADSSKKDLSYRMKIKGSNEIRQLAQYYSSFMQRLECFYNKLQRSEIQYRSIYENSVEGIFQMRRDGTLISANPSLAVLLGYSTPENLIEDNVNCHIPLYSDVSQHDTLLKMLDEKNVVIDYKTSFHTKNQKIIWMSLNARAVRDADGKMLHIEGFLVDITERVKMEEKMQHSHKELEKRVKERTEELSSRVDELEYRNLMADLLRDMSEMLQACRNNAETYPVIKSFISRFFPKDSGIMFVFSKTRTTLEQVFCWGNPVENKNTLVPDDCWALRQGKNFFLTQTDNDMRCAHLLHSPGASYICVPMLGPAEGVGLFYLEFAMREPHITEINYNHSIKTKKRTIMQLAEHLALSLTNLDLRETLHLQSFLDPLTGIRNRRYLTEALFREASRVKRNQSSLGILMIDIDNFKSFNDLYGHDFGDEVLRKLAAHLNIKTRAEDFVCRYGGEEFILVMVDTNHKDVMIKAKQLCSGIQENIRIRYKNDLLKITVSIGVAMFPEHRDTIEGVIGAADQALYKAKSDGKNTVASASPPDEEDKSEINRA